MRRSGAVMAIICTSSLAAFSKTAIAEAACGSGRSALALAGGVGLLAAGTVALPRSASPRFYPDDPLWTDDDRVVDASKAAPIEDSNGYDFVVNTFGHPGERRDVRALNVNTVDEVPDSSWFTNRIGRKEMSAADIARGPDRLGARDHRGLEGLRRQERRRAARLPHDRPARARSIRSKSTRRRIRSWRAESRSSAPPSTTRSATTWWTSISPRSIASRS